MKMLVITIPKLKILTKLVINTHNINILDLLEVLKSDYLKELRITAPLTYKFYKLFYCKLDNHLLRNLEYIELKNTLPTTEIDLINQLLNLFQHKLIEYEVYYK